MKKNTPVQEEKKIKLHILEKIRAVLALFEDTALAVAGMATIVYAQKYSGLPSQMRSVVVFLGGYMVAKVVVNQLMLRRKA